MIRLLIVDDEPMSIQIIRKLLAPLEEKIEKIYTAENGIEAMQIITSAAAPNVVITDMNMPALNGISLLEYIAENHPDLFVIVVSGYYDYKYTHAAIQAKVVDYLLKPVDRQELLSAVNKVIARIDSDYNKVNVSLEETSKIDQESYYYLLKSSKKTGALIQNGDLNEINSQLTSDFSYIKREIQENLYPFVYKIYADAIAHFYIEHEYPVPSFPSFEEAYQEKHGDIETAIRELVNICLADIDKYRRHSSGDENLSRINRYIYDHYAENISLSGIAELFYINQNYLSTLFRKKYGENISQLIIRLKITDAKRQLRYSDRTLTEISESLGYINPSYFNKQFKKETGMSPGQFRSQFKHSQNE